MTKGEISNTHESATKDEGANDETADHGGRGRLVFLAVIRRFVLGSFVLRHSFALRDFVLRHSLQATGSLSLKVLPLPGALSTSMLPPWTWATCLTIERPRPVPPISRDRERSTR